MELVTEDLTPLRWAQEIDHLAEFMQVAGKHELTVSYGWGCDLDMDDLYQEVPLPLSGLREWIEQSTASGIFTLGESMLHIYSQDREISIDIGNEGEVHLTIDNAELAQKVASGWTARSITYYEVGPKQQPA